MGWQMIKRPANKNCAYCKQSAWKNAVWLLTELGLFCSSRCHDDYEDHRRRELR